MQDAPIPLCFLKCQWTEFLPTPLKHNEHNWNILPVIKFDLNAIDNDKLLSTTLIRVRKVELLFKMLNINHVTRILTLCKCDLSLCVPINIIIFETVLCYD